jgi:predicted transposase/invertase (TIGR01784 family)
VGLCLGFPRFLEAEEIEAMFGLSELKKIRVYQEALEEGELRGKLKAVLPMLAAGLTLEQIAQALDLSIEQVRQAAENQFSA